MAQMKAEHCRKARENYNKCMDDARSMISESMRLATMATCKGFLDACR
ncbi:MAG TPA: hypothetical protein VE685_09805 [Thermoanaerobaculia bacterium]|nr:hypothetical protein [Thermoanaerobaculia bacterium]